MDDDPPTKRVKLDIAENPNPSVQTTTTAARYERGELWLDDGNVVLVAEGAAFRVHKSILSMNSEIFRDMFAMPQPADAETWEGCAVVHLQDSKKDLMHILRPLFDAKNSMSLGFKSKPTFAAVSAMLRLGTKYHIDHLRQDAIRRLEDCFPPRLANFRNRYTSSSTLVTDDSEFLTSDAVTVTADAAIAVISIARTYDLSQLLPPAFYICAHFKTADLVRGFVDEDGNVWKMSSEDVFRCLDGAVELRNISARQHQSLVMGSPSPRCLQRSNCAARIIAFRDSMCGQDITTVTGIIAALQSAPYMWFSRTNPDSLICSYCARHFATAHDLSRKRTWETLAKIFNLDGVQWPVLGEA